MIFSKHFIPILEFEDEQDSHPVEVTLGEADKKLQNKEIPQYVEKDNIEEEDGKPQT